MMDDLKIEPCDMWMRKKTLAQNEWYTYLGKYHVAKKAIDRPIEFARNIDIGVGSIHSWQMPFCCKEEIPNRDELEKLLLAIKDHVSELVGKAFNVDFVSHEHRNGEISYFVLIRKKIDKSKLRHYSYLHKEVDDE